MAFSGNRAGYQYDVCVVRPGSDGQTTGMTRLTTNPGQDALAVGGDGGKRILFLSDRDEGIYRMKLATEGPRDVPAELTKNTRAEPEAPPLMNDRSPGWSPGGEGGRSSTVTGTETWRSTA